MLRLTELGGIMAVILLAMVGKIALGLETALLRQLELVHWLPLP